jgi:conjugative transfer signal peptidase TraF
MTDQRAELRGTVKWPVGLIAAGASCAALAGTFLWKPAPVLLWNASASSPVGLYLVTARARPSVGDTVVAWAPAAARGLAAARGYLPFNVPLVKRVAAVAGDRVCARRDRIYVNDRVATLRRRHDPSGRPMPWWSGCRVLRSGELFLLTRGMPNAFDGRYFGVTRRDEFVGKARLLWPKAAKGPGHG